MRDEKVLRKLYDTHLSKAVKVNFPHFVDAAKGTHVQTVDGREFIDLTGGIGVMNLGHGHPGVLEALSVQMQRYLHLCFTVQMYDAPVLLAEKLAAIMPPGLTKTAFFNSGAEAVENAAKFSRNVTGRSAIISFENSFHGRTFFTMALTGKVRPYKGVFGPAFPGVYQIPYPDPYRSPDGPEGAVDRSMEALERLFHTQVAAEEVAAIIVEPIQGEGGFIVPPDGFLQGLREVCDQTGIVLVDDEVQSGLGRSGRWNAIDHFGVTPDLVTSGKAIGGGLPLSAVTGTPEIMDHPPAGSIGGTFGGNPLSCAAGLAAIEGIESVLPDVQGLESRLRNRLEGWVQAYPAVGEARGLGAMRAIELVIDPHRKEPAPKLAKAVQDLSYQSGLLVLTAGSYDNVVRFHPPLNMEPDALDAALDLAEKALEKAIAQS